MLNDTHPKSTQKLGIWLLLALTANGALLRLALSLAMRDGTRNPIPAAAIAWALAALALTASLLWLLRSVWRRRDSWALSLGAALLCIVFYKVGRNHPELAPIELPLAILLLAPAALLVWAFVRQVRRADELERKILFQALAFAFVIEFSVAIVYALLEGMDVPRPPSILWASLLVMSWAAGLGIFARRYE
jgi:hypothetical protein